MCGLVGFFAPTTTTDINLQNFANMLVVDQIRGMHATGVAKVNVRTNTVTVHKRADNAIDFLARQDTKDFLSKERGHIYIGHNRYATMGNKEDHENAHPFQADHITLVHNGVVDAHAMDLLEGMNDPLVKVDSHGVALTIAKHGVKKAVTEHLSGGFALVWWDANERTLNFIRNADRPLYMAVLSDSTLVWASEKGMLDVFFKRPGNRGLTYRVEPLLIEHSSLLKFKFNEYGNRIGQAPVVEGMQFLDLPFPKSQSGTGWWDSLGTSHPSVRTSSPASNVVNLNTNDASKQRLSASEQSNKNRVNGVLEYAQSPLRYGSIVTLDITSIHTYDTNRSQVRVVGSERTHKIELDLWGLDASRLDGVSVIRAEVDNAYHNRGKLVISCKKASISLLDPIAKDRGVPCYLSAYLTVAEKEEERMMKVQRERNMSAAKSQTATVSYPLKVHGHTFMTREEFTDFTSQGCDCCGDIPTAYSRKNNSIKVNPGKTMGSLLDDSTFTCGGCVEEK